MLPPVAGIENFYGQSIHHCPYCDGFEHRGQRLAVYANGPGALPLSLKLLTWSHDVMLLTDGPCESTVTAEQRQVLMKQGVVIRHDRLVCLAGTGGRLEKIIFAGGEELSRDALFFSTGQVQHSGLPSQLGCDFTDKGVVPVGKHQVTRVPGLYVAGDCSIDMNLIIVAAAEGTKAAIAIHESLIEDDLRVAKT
jgi:thioredoxin reductase